MAHELDLTVAPQLPIAAAAEEIAELLSGHQVIIVAGETGSGKTTQLPKICLAVGRERVAHTQPRRIAARTVAARIATECGVELGDQVGYQVRFTRKASRETRVKVMTDGILLSELGRDRDLSRYDTIIIDEAHERSLNIDFLLGYLKRLIQRRPELRVIVTSATIDTQRFSEHFGGAPIVEVSGRSYPVEIRYEPLAEGSDEIDAVAAAVEEIATSPGGGDILVFLSGEREIRDATDAVTALQLPGWEVLGLYSRLAAADQQRVFQAHSARRVVLATNVAETSITVPGIRYVIDAGNARISRYSARTKVQRLPIEAVSQASANQRAGRCGRVGPGVAIRLYSQEAFESRPEFTEPEILRTNLATVILLMAQAGLGDIESFPFVEPPVMSQINDGLRVLSELGAISPRQRHHQVRLTRIGRLLARMPVDPRLGRMLVEASRRGCLRQVQVLVAGLTVPDVRERPLERQSAADELHRRFTRPATEPDAAEGLSRHTPHTGTRPDRSARRLEGGDFEALLNVWEYLRGRRRELSGNAFRRMCRDEYLHFVRFREWEDLVSQLREVCRDLELPAGGDGAMPEVMMSLLSGLLSHVGLAEPERRSTASGQRRPLREYQGARGARFAIQPGSALAGANPPELVVAYELVETSRLWARTVAAVRAEWIEAVGKHALTRTLSEPHWSASRSSVVAAERLTLFGVPIVAGRRTGYAADHPQEAREIFIRAALVEGDWNPDIDVVRDNRFAMAEAERLTERMRRPDLLSSDEDVFVFYDSRLGSEVVSGSAFQRWLREPGNASGIRLTAADLVTDPGAVRISDFPDRWEVSGIELPVTYQYDPGAGHDGVSVEVKLQQLHQLDAAPFTWQVPGLRTELATELVRTLPKAVRTKFVPAPDTARRALAWLAATGIDHHEPFEQALGRALTFLTGETVPVDVWRPELLPSHLRVTFIVIDGSRVRARGTDVNQLSVDLAPAVRQKLTASARRVTGTGQKSWTFGTIASTTTLEGVQAYPCLVDEAATVGVQVAESADRANASHEAGLRRLLTLVNPSPVRWVVAHLTNTDKLALGSSPYSSVPELLDDAWLKASGRLAAQLQAPSSVRDQVTFEQLAGRIRQDQAPTTAAIVQVAARTLALRADIDRQLSAFDPASPTRTDVDEQLGNLLFPRFISATPDPWFDRLPSYLRAIVVRLSAARSDPGREDRARVDVERVEAEYAALCAAQPPGKLLPEVEEIAFLVEELRVSLFAQSVRASIPISVKRVRQAMKRVAG
ncbi:MAG: ATP-dependent RNA helicase HrpA [Arachnia sp.]